MPGQGCGLQGGGGSPPAVCSSSPWHAEHWSHQAPAGLAASTTDKMQICLPSSRARGIPGCQRGGSSPVSLQGSGGAEGVFVQNGAGEDPGHWQGSALPSATLKVDKSHPASRAHHSPAELAQHPPGCQPSPKSGLRAQVPGLAGLPAPSLYPGEAPGWASSDVRNYSPGLLLLLR